MKKSLLTALAITLLTITSTLAGTKNLATRDFTKVESFSQKTDSTSKQKAWTKDKALQVADSSVTGYDHLHRPIKPQN